MVYEAIRELVRYGLEKGLITEDDAIYARNQILEVLKMDEYEEPEKDGELTGAALEKILKVLLDYAAEKGLLQENSVVYRDLFDTKLMNCLMPRPSEVTKTFWEKYQVSPETATDYYYNLSRNSDYIRRYRVSKDMKWTTDTKYGTLDITVNLSKPEKDPKAIAAAKLAKQSGYPKCQLCMENIGYAGRVNHPARNNHRVIPITINDSKWGFQYSPYVYYNEHCIVFNGQHIPMKIERATFRKLFDFISQFPHYFLGSNADLPIVGGSILSHDHFQGGHYTFAMAKAEIEKYVRELAKRYGQDDRVIIWNIWNELGNSGRGEKSLPMAKKVIGWLREEDVKQPLTIEMWGAQVKGNYYEWLNNPCFHGEVGWIGKT